MSRNVPLPVTRPRNSSPLECRVHIANRYPRRLRLLHVAESMNAQRAGWAQDAIVHFAHTVGLDPVQERREALHDLLCDLGHFADRHSLNIREEVRRALETWRDEKGGPLANGTL
jgi:hypothetical protein